MRLYDSICYSALWTRVSFSTEKLLQALSCVCNTIQYGLIKQLLEASKSNINTSNNYSNIDSKRLLKMTDDEVIC